MFGIPTMGLLANIQSSATNTLKGKDSVHTSQNNPELNKEDDQYFQLMFNLYLMKCYQATNIAEAYLTQQHLQASKILQQQNCDGAFDHFFNESVMFVSGKGYLIIDVNLFRQVIRTFFYYAQNEYEKILLKIESDQKYKINFTEKALQEFDEM